MIAMRQRRALERVEWYVTSPGCGTRSSGGGSGGSSACEPGGGELRTTPRTGTARVTACVGRASASLMIATSTGVNAAEASVPGAQIFEQVYAAAADAAAVMSRVERSMPPLREDDERVSAWLDTQSGCPTSACTMHAPPSREAKI